MMPLRDISRTEIFIMDENKKQPISERRIGRFIEALNNRRSIQFFGVDYIVQSFTVDGVGSRSEWKFDLNYCSPGLKQWLNA